MVAKMKKGMLISFEGGEGSGKTVQIKLLADWLRERGCQVLITREPGGTVIGEQIRAVLLNPKNIGMAFTTEVLLFQAGRAQLYRELILPSLRAGKVVLSDRGRDSSLVYQGMVRGFGEKLIERLNNFATQNTYPELTIYLDVPVEIGLKRRNGTGKMDRLDMEKKDFHQKVREGYLKLVKANDHRRWFKFDATQSIEAIHQAIIKLVEEKLFKK